MLQKALIGILFFILVLKFNKTFSRTVFTNFAVNERIAKIPDLKQDLLMGKKSSTATIIAWITSNSNFRFFFIYHKHSSSFLACLWCIWFYISSLKPLNTSVYITRITLLLSWWNYNMLKFKCQIKKYPTGCRIKK